MTKKSFTSGTPMHEQVRDHLLDLIQDGTLAPGEAIGPERKLAEQLGVSRHTVRQALSALEGIGLIQIRHGSGIYVTESAPDDAIIRVSQMVMVREGSVPRVLEVRRSLEPYMARLAAQRRTDEDLQRLKSLITYGRNDSEGVAGTQSTSFHREIAKATQNLVFDGVMRTLITGPRRAETLLNVRGDARPQWEGQHAQIFKAIEDRDADLAEKLMSEHLDTVIAVSDEVHDCSCSQNQ